MWSSRPVAHPGGSLACRPEQSIGAVLVFDGFFFSSCRRCRRLRRRARCLPHTNGKKWAGGWVGRFCPRHTFRVGSHGRQALLVFTYRGRTASPLVSCAGWLVVVRRSGSRRRGGSRRGNNRRSFCPTSLFSSPSQVVVARGIGVEAVVLLRLCLCCCGGAVRVSPPLAAWPFPE